MLWGKSASLTARSVSTRETRLPSPQPPPGVFHPKPGSIFSPPPITHSPLTEVSSAGQEGGGRVAHWSGWLFCTWLKITISVEGLSLRKTLG